MDDTNAFESQVGREVVLAMGPLRPVDDAAIFGAITATTSLKWRFQALFRVTRFVAAAVIVALFGGFLLVAQYSEQRLGVPGAETEGRPPLTGPTGNGLIAFVHEGDIVVGDPETGKSEVIVEGENGARPIFSPDGTHIAFLRLTAPGIEPCDIIVVRADGSDERDITPGDGLGCIGAFGWAPDSRAVMVTDYSPPEWPLMLLDASGATDPVVLPMNDVTRAAASFLRPPDGDRLLTWGETPALAVMDLDGSDVVDLGEASGLEAKGYDDFADPSWSPDGARIAVLAKAGGERHLYVMDADGSDLRRLAAIPWHEAWEGPPWSWSPDGSTIAVQEATLVEPSLRDSCRNDAAGIDRCGEAMWVTLINVESGEERVLDATYSPYEADGAIGDWSWSPDGRAILFHRQFWRGSPEVVDIETDTATELPWESDFLLSWQRVAAD